MTPIINDLVKDLPNSERLRIHEELIKHGIERQVPADDTLSKYLGFKLKSTASMELFGKLTGDMRLGSIRFKKLDGQTVTYLFSLPVKPTDPKQLAQLFIIMNNKALGRHPFYDLGEKIQFSNFGNNVALALSPREVAEGDE